MVSRVRHIIRWSCQDYRTSRTRMRSFATNDPYLRLVYLELLNALPENGGEITADAEHLADVLLCPVEEIRRCIPILVKIGEVGRGGIVVEEDVIFNRRIKEDIAEDIEYSKTQSENGKKGGRPKRSVLEENQTLNPPTPLPMPTPVPKPVPSPEPSGAGAPDVLPSSLDVPAFRKIWDDYHAYRRGEHLRPWKAKTRAMKLEEMAEWGAELAIEALRRSIANGWQGVFDPRDGKPLPNQPRRGGPPSPRSTSIPRVTE